LLLLEKNANYIKKNKLLFAIPGNIKTYLGKESGGRRIWYNKCKNYNKYKDETLDETEEL